MNQKNRYLNTLERFKVQGFYAGFAGVLMIFCVLTRIFIPFETKRVSVKLPEADNGKFLSYKGERMTVYIKKDGSINLDEYQVEGLPKLPAIIKKRMAEMKDMFDYKVNVAADGDLRYGEVRNVLDSLSKNGITVAGLATVTRIREWDQKEEILNMISISTQ